MPMTEICFVCRVHKAINILSSGHMRRIGTSVMVMTMR